MIRYRAFYPQRLSVYGRRTEGKRDVSRERGHGSCWWICGSYGGPRYFKLIELEGPLLPETPATLTRKVHTYMPLCYNAMQRRTSWLGVE